MGFLLKIATHHSNKQTAENLNAIIKHILVRAKCSFELSTYVTNKKILDNISISAYFYDIFLLDADDKESLYIAERLRSKNLEAAVIFLSTDNTEIISLLKYRPTSVITNPSDPQSIYDAFRVAYLERKRLDSFFTVKTREQIVTVNYKDIDYFENSQKIVALHSRSRRERIEFYAKFDDIYSTLPKDRFLKCHQSLIVNMGAIKRLDKANRQFDLNSGLTIDISKRMLSEVSEAFRNYCDLHN